MARSTTEATPVDGAACTIVFGHNATVRRVLMQFSVPAERLVFSPEEAEDVAAKLRLFARRARGERPTP
jgi:hypothetical protein